MGRLQHLAFGPLAPLSLLLAAWPVVIWATRRWWASPDERWHLLPLVLLLMAVGLRRRDPSSGMDLRIPPVTLLFMWLYVGLYAAFHAAALGPPPALLLALCLTAALAALISRRLWGHWLAPGVWGSLLLAVPTLPSLHFFLGYPWRRGTTLATAELLRFSGLSVTAEGAELHWAGGVVAVDAPCSGLYMSWVVAVFLVALWLFNDTGIHRSLLTAGLALALVLATNVLRAAALFYLQSGRLPATFKTAPWHHDAMGLVLFVPLCWLLARWMMQPASAVAQDARRAPIHRSRRPPQGPLAPPSPSQRRLFALALLVGGAAPLWTGGQPALTTPGAFPGWPTTLEGKLLEPLPLTPREYRFAEGFPGRLGRFHDGRRELILRWVEHPTRKLHPASHCFKAHGYDIVHRPLHVDALGRSWSSFVALAPGDSAHREPLVVLEGIRDADGKQWPDVSAWYWAALLGHSRGPWWSTVVARHQPTTDDAGHDAVDSPDAVGSPDAVDSSDAVGSAASTGTW